MWRSFCALIKKDWRLMWSSKFLLLALGSLLLYSCYINLVYVRLDQDIYPVYLYDPACTQSAASAKLIPVNSPEELQAKAGDGYGVGIDASGPAPRLVLASSGVPSADRQRAAYAASLLNPAAETAPEILGTNSKEMKNRREITCEFLFFELAAVGFLGLASTLFKEKQMGVVRVHGVLPVRKTAFIFSKLCLFLLADLAFAALLTLINLGVSAGLAVLPAVLLQGGILSLLMALVGFLCAILLPNFKQFSLLYLVLAVFVSTPVFLVGQTGLNWGWINYHPMYHLFMAIKRAYFGVPAASGFYYVACGAALVLLFWLVRRALSREMAKEG